jgi:Transmembrane amino acid transporter protein
MDKRIPGIQDRLYQCVLLPDYHRYSGSVWGRLLAGDDGMGSWHCSVYNLCHDGGIVSFFPFLSRTRFITLIAWLDLELDEADLFSSGYLIWKCFMGLDSYQFPLRNYSDLAFRIYGPTVRHIFNFLQSVQLLFSVGLIVISNGQALSQVSKFRLCYAICCLLWALCGFAVGQIRTLRRYGWLASCAVWINLLIMFISMGAFAHYPPNYSIATLGSAGSLVNQTTITPDPVTGKYPPVIHYNSLPNPGVLVGALNGLMQAVYAYGGALLFVEFMAEMRRPRDFLKAMWGAQFFIWVVYLTYGCYTYYFQGQ